MTKYGEAYNYKVSDYLRDMETYVPLSRLDAVLINTDTDYPKSAIAKYKKEHSIPVEDDIATLNLPVSVRVIRAPLVSKLEIKSQKGDTLKRSIIRHDGQKLAKELLRLL
jgi:hypothetical protein